MARDTVLGDVVSRRAFVSATGHRCGVQWHTADGHGITGVGNFRREDST